MTTGYSSLAKKICPTKKDIAKKNIPKTFATYLMKKIRLFYGHKTEKGTVAGQLLSWHVNTIHSQGSDLKFI